jgi:uncharacterized protein with PIN domain
LEENLKFIADSMLGRLARWLRLLGYDTLYFTDIEDSLLLRIARDEHRVLLTRDRGIVKVRGLGPHLLLSENNSFAQLEKVIHFFDLMRTGELPPLHSRCTVCNGVLADITKEQARGHVPEYVFETTSSFRRCTECNRIYWKGTHTDRIDKKLSELLKE